VGKLIQGKNLPLALLTSTTGWGRFGREVSRIIALREGEGRRSFSGAGWPTL
jgi:hypothetical protein